MSPPRGPGQRSRCPGRPIWHLKPTPRSYPHHRRHSGHMASVHSLYDAYPFLQQHFSNQLFIPFSEGKLALAIMFHQLTWGETSKWLRISRARVVKINADSWKGFMKVCSLSCVIRSYTSQSSSRFDLCFTFLVLGQGQAGVQTPFVF